ncbi:polysaccharide biosynthesis protein [Natribacillus halophilus]|uniref:NDP-sugar epimerase, includes UDP-GlcNAc-inverting 4,6-dehydratase FlaA1 and capsular polysaccharide biosynthesis protein EpsC n=1 Tax=Natribacillus halophilus TaxID=549003 RepID=A0A1G8KFS7_9BACI|nr:nucleoside-diphosphate sugar epimerase/dehydratase [Natribacillus halophilus]SDI42281.1 NDP-sugar epimerase, includes UDP-GlcNAc-inverting 4,6-dehydratase FlaA1 and capsular polysaccharide biosynthesis protein EpsC [Natribacillus halophilus]
MRYSVRMLVVMSIDSLIVLSAIFIGAYLLYDVSGLWDNLLVVTAIVLVITHHIFAYIFKLYKGAWQYASTNELLRIFYAVTLTILVAAAVQLLFFDVLYARALTVTWMLHILLIGGTRFAWRLFRDHYMRPKKGLKRTLIIGAGAGGTLVARQLKGSPEAELRPVAYVDDDPTKQHLEILNVPVAGEIGDIQHVVEKYRIEHIVIAIPSMKREELQHIHEQCMETNIKPQIMPMLEDLINGKLEVSQIRDVQVEDLLGRDPVELDTEGIADTITGKVVLVTGAGGSIGSELCRQLCKFDPSEMILLGHGENSIYSIFMELKNTYTHITFDTEIADIQGKERMQDIMKKYRPDVVYHAAAHKHVPLMEKNPQEAVQNNVIGTRNVAEAADTTGVNTFVMISSDKAVNPTSVMGATKRIAEMVVQHLNRTSATRFVAVRFGNVLGSRGSVIPLFKRQIEGGGPVTVTHPEMTRYFMTIPEASRLVIQAGALAADGGEIFVLDMGEPVKIVDLARNLIRFSGFGEGDIGIEYTGMRPGEKMYEELLKDEEIEREQVYPKIHIGRTVNVNLNYLNYLLKDFHSIPVEGLKHELLNLASFKPEQEISLSEAR